SHFEKLCNVKIPDDVLKTVLDFAIESEKALKQDIEAIACVIKAQAEKFGRMSEIKNYIYLLDKDKQIIADKRIKEMINCRCNYTFY
ncbi:MAG: hypothetical protein Q8N88_05990, partial [Nanoarchaeota archaeon]|nr:hypothetical protein [Nanoarchaeota archaeon]